MYALPTHSGIGHRLWAFDLGSTSPRKRDRQIAQQDLENLTWWVRGTELYANTPEGAWKDSRFATREKLGAIPTLKGPLRRFSIELFTFFGGGNSILAIMPFFRSLQSLVEDLKTVGLTARNIIIRPKTFFHGAWTGQDQRREPFSTIQYIVLTTSVSLALRT